MGSFSASRISRADRRRGRRGGLGFATARETPASGWGGFTGLAKGAFPPASWRTGGVAEGGLTAERVAALTSMTDFFGIGEEIWSQDDPAAALKDLIAAMG